MVRALGEMYDQFRDLPDIELVCSKSHNKVSGPSEVFSLFQIAKRQEHKVSNLSFAEKKHLFRLIWVGFKSSFHADENSVFKYLEGRGEIDEIGITKKNARRLLMVAKTIDLANIHFAKLFGLRFNFKHTSYDLRSQILKACSPGMQTIEAYTIPFFDYNSFDNTALRIPSNWCPERIALYAKMLMAAYTQLVALSKKLEQKAPRIYALRGNTASGKSTRIKELLLRLHKQALLESDLKGQLDPDILKSVLQKLVNVTGKQVHYEVARGPLKGYIEGVMNLPFHSLIHNTRLTTIDELAKVVRAAERRPNGRVSLIDIEVSLTTSLLRVLVMRDPVKEPACVDPLTVAKGYREIKLNRLNMISHVKREKVIDYYDLFYTDSIGKTHLVAKKRGAVFTIRSRDQFVECCRVPCDEEVHKQMHQIITSEFIEQSIARKDIPEQRRLQLTRWKGTSIFQALEQHVNCIS